MPAAIPFSFPDTVMPAASAAASAGAAKAEGASPFGQMVDAAAQTEISTGAQQASPAMPPKDAARGEWAAAGAGAPLMAEALSGVAGLDAAGAEDVAGATEDGAGAMPAIALDGSAEAARSDGALQLATPVPVPAPEADQAEAVHMAGDSEIRATIDADTAAAAPPWNADGDAALQAARDAVLEGPDGQAQQQAAAHEGAPAATALAAALAAKSQSTMEHGSGRSADTQPAADAADGLTLATSRKAEGQLAQQAQVAVAAAASAAEKADFAEAAKLADAAEAGDTSAAGSSKDGPQSAASPSAALAAAKPAAMEAGGLSATLLTQAMAPMGQTLVAHGAHPYAAALGALPLEPVVKAEAGRFGADVGAEIAKVAKGEGDSLLIRLDPRDMGRVDVRLSFDREGILRAVMSVDSPAALDMLRRESGELNRALTEAGVKSDAQSLRFDARADGGAGQGGPQGESQGQNARSGSGTVPSGHGEATAADYQPLRTTTQVDLIA